MREVTILQERMSILVQSDMRLHFKTEEAYNGFAKVSGIIRAERRQLVIEYQVKDNIFGVIKGRPKELVIPYEQLADVKYKVNWFLSRLELHVNAMRILGEFPVGEEGVIKLGINRKQKKTAKEMASYINLRASEIRLEMMDEDFTSLT